MRFVIIDDDIGFRKTLRTIIERYHLGVVVAECGDALKGEIAIREFNPDIVVVELLLSRKTGIDLAKTFSDTNNDISFILTSSYLNKSIIKHFFLSGIDFYLRKPIDVLSTTSFIEKVIENKLEQRNIKLKSERNDILSGHIAAR